jgi:hypothetical protein
VNFYSQFSHLWFIFEICSLWYLILCFPSCNFFWLLNLLNHVVLFCLLSFDAIHIYCYNLATFLLQFLSLLNSNVAFICELMRDCYEAFAMYCFERYLIACLGGYFDPCWNSAEVKFYCILIPLWESEQKKTFAD